ncbi:MAG: alpha/beta hydrolase [Streptosporangiaceae bacterium]|nr:alpha/beta hydrolase [Streptosporangiaceae bacterium]MBV9855198.1 alpha/beta hydrolase [Streptosporangiaceae bacterium]
MSTGTAPADPVPLWPGQLVSLGDRDVFLRSARPGVPGDAGDFEPALCVHGLEGSSANWTDLMAELLPRMACEALDLPGFGYSPPPRGQRGYSITAQAGVVTKLIEQRYGGRPVHLIGNSLGGAVCVRVAAGRPGLIRTLTLLSPVLPDRWPDPSLFKFPLLCVPAVGHWLISRASQFSAEQRVAAIAAAVCYDSREIHPARLAGEVAEVKRRDTLGYADAALIASTRALIAERFSRTLWREAARIEAPTLVIFGSHDRLVDPRLAGRAARAFGGARVIVLPRTGHVAQMEHPATVAAEIRALGMRQQPARLTHV